MDPAEALRCREAAAVGTTGGLRLAQGSLKVPLPSCTLANTLAIRA